MQLKRRDSELVWKHQADLKGKEWNGKERTGRDRTGKARLGKGGEGKVKKGHTVFNSERGKRTQDMERREI